MAALEVGSTGEFENGKELPLPTPSTEKETHYDLREQQVDSNILVEPHGTSGSISTTSKIDSNTPPNESDKVTSSPSSSFQSRRTERSNQSTTRRTMLSPTNKTNLPRKPTATTTSPSLLEEEDDKAKLHYFQQKREKQYSKISSIRREWQEEKEKVNKQRSRNLWEAQNLLNLAEFEKQREQRKRKEQEEKEKQKETDYKLVLRETRRNELKQLNKDFDAKEKLRQQKLLELDAIHHQIHVGTKDRLEDSWSTYDSDRNARLEARRKERIEMRNAKLGLDEHYHQKIEKEQRQMENEEEKSSSWVNVYETKCREDNLHLNRTVKEEIMINIVDNERDDEEDEEDTIRSKRITNQQLHPPKNQKAINQYFSNTKRSVADTVLIRSRQHRQQLMT